MSKPTPTHLDYAEEAEAAQRAEAWPQAAALWRRAADALRASAPHTTETFDLHAKYQARPRGATPGTGFARSSNRSPRPKLQIPTLRERKSDGHDFHEVSVWGLKRALSGRLRGGPQRCEVTPVSLFPKERCDEEERSEDRQGLHCQGDRQAWCPCGSSGETHGGWDATNIATGRKVRIKSAQRLRRKCTEADLAGLERPTPKQRHEGGHRGHHVAHGGHWREAAGQGDQEGQAGAKAATRAKRAAKAAKPAKPKRISGLTAAFMVLVDADAELGVKRSSRRPPRRAGGSPMPPRRRRRSTPPSSGRSPPRGTSPGSSAAPSAGPSGRSARPSRSGSCSATRRRPTFIKRSPPPEARLPSGLLLRPDFGLTPPASTVYTMCIRSIGGVTMTKTLIKHGNSLALVIDKPILEMLQISADTPLELRTDGDSI